MKKINYKQLLRQLLIVGAPLLTLVVLNPSSLHYIDHWLCTFQVPNLKENLSTHRFLTGPYEPVQKIHTGLPVHVVSKNPIPFDLHGVFIRNGPNPIRNEKLYHWFDGHGMIHSIIIDPNTSRLSANYSNAYVPTSRFIADLRDQVEYFLNVGEFKGIIGLLKVLVIQPLLIQVLYWTGKIPTKDGMRLGQANTHTMMLPDGRYLILHEASLPFEAKLSPNAIPVSGKYVDFNGQLNFPVSAHPRLVQSSNHSSSFVFHCYSGDPSQLKASNGSAVKYGELNTATNELKYYHGLKGLEKVLPFMHDFIVTEKYLVFFKTSVLLDAAEAFFGKKEGPPEIFKFFPDSNFSIAVVSRDPERSANVTWIDLPYPAVVVHTLNGWDMKEEGKITAWAPVGYTFDGTLVKNNTNRYFMTEMIIDLKTASVSMDIISKDYNVEFPRVRDECVGKPCRFGFSGVINQDDHFHGFVQVDTQDKSLCFTPYQWGERKFIGGESVIIPKKGKKGSDEVYIGSFVIDSTTGDNYFAVWDGQKCNGDAVVVFETPRVPLGFHGNWITPELFSKHLLRQ